MYKTILKFTILSFISGCLIGLGNIPGASAQTPVYDATKSIGSFFGTHDRERVGYWLSPAGDVNGDGYDDFLIANYHTTTNGYDAGSAYLILGKPNEDWAHGISLTQADAKFLGESNYSAFGYHVGGGGDVNGDGLSDMIMGSPAGNEDGKDRPGTAYIIFGRRAADWGNSFVPEYSADASYEGEVDFDQLGKSVAIVGDMNNDGFDDIAIGAPYYDISAVNGGKVYIILGKSTGWVTNGKIMQHCDASFRSDLESDYAGYMLSGAGDVNGDGCDDLIVGAYGKGNAYLIFGRPSANWGQNVDMNSVDVVFEAENRFDNVGWIVASAGDVNHDGFDDILITTPYNGDNGQESGKTYLIFGHAGEWIPEFDLSTADASFLGEAAFDNSGWTASGVGDINGDRFEDFMIGAWYNDQAGEDAGKAYIIYGKETGWQPNVNLATVSEYILGEGNIDYMGFSVAAGGDINNDGLADFIVSAPYSNEAFEWGGKIHAFLGERPKYPISGKVTYYDNAQPVPGVALKFYGTVDDSTFSDGAGNYDWIIPDGRDLTQWARKNRGSDQDLMTILSYDAALVARYAVGLETFTAHQQQAADVDLDDNITTFDASLIAQYVVNPDVNSEGKVGAWLFEPSERHYLDIDAALTDQNFTAIVAGNVHGGWVPPTQFRKKSTLPQIAKPVVRINGDRLSVPIQIPAKTDLLALDLQLQFDPAALQFSKVQKGAAITDFSLLHRETDGNLTVSLFGIQPVAVDAQVCEIQFKVLSNEIETSELTITRFIVNTQAYQSVAAAVVSSESQLPASFILEQNFPNPFNPSTTINYHLPQQTNVQIVIYNLMGQEIRTFVNGIQTAGQHLIQWDGKDKFGNDVASGIYLYKAILGKEVKIRRMVKLM